MKKYSNEFKVGIFFVISLLGLIYLTASTGKFHIRDEGYNIYVVFDDVSGLQKDSPVMLNGLEVGRVQELAISDKDDKAKILLKLLIRKDIKIYNSAVVSIKTLGLMGEKYVHIKNRQGERFIEPGSLLEGRSPADMDVLFSEAEILSKNVNTLAQETKELVQNLNATIKENRQSLSKSMFNISEISERINLTLKNNQQSLDNIISNLENVSANFEILSEDLKRHPWKLIFRTKEKKPEEHNAER